jgi:hypothetical protein
MDDEALSWFVDNDVTKALLAVRGVGSVAAWAASPRGAGGAGPGAAAGAERHRRRRLAPAAPGAAGSAGRPHRRGRRRAVGAHHRHGEVGAAELARWTSRWPTAAASGWTRWPPSATPWPSRAAPRCWTASRWWASRSSRSQRRRRSGRGRGVRAVLARAARPPPRGGASPRPSTSSTRWQENYDGSMLLLYEGALLAVLVVWLFLRDWRATLVAGGAAAVGHPGLRGMHLLGFTLNVVTLLSAVAGGRHPGGRRHRRDREHHAPPAHGQDALPGGHGGGRRDRPGGDRHHLHADRGVPAHRLHGGVPGKFFVQFGWTAAIAVFFSLVVARMLTPMMAAYMLKPPKAHGPQAHDPRLDAATWAGPCAGACGTAADTCWRAAVFFVGSFCWCRCCPPASSRRTTSQTQVT